jgi:hypothetical protein
MSRKGIIVLVIALSMLLVASVALAQPWKCWRGNGGKCSNYKSIYMEMIQ